MYFITLYFLLLLLFSLCLPPCSSTPVLRSTSISRAERMSHPIMDKNGISPTNYFEVTKPIQLPGTKPCSKLVLQHNFGSTYGKSPVFAPYTPPSNCPSSEFSKIVLEWTAMCKGRQYDRIFGVWLGGVELLRSCTAEPRPSGIIWTVKKDITRYYSLLMTNQTVAVYLGNIIDVIHTGVYHVNLSFHFYPVVEKRSSHWHKPWADLILPISRNLPLKDGLWFEIENSTDIESRQFKIPRNAYRAVLEVYVSFHENDEFWYANFPNDYISANHLTGVAGNGPFREVVVGVDSNVVGAVWPFTVMHTGGVNPFLWRPITGIGSFDLPSYDIEITPFLGTILDGKSHNFEFSVTNALNVWFIDANLHIWLDKKSSKTEGKLLKQKISPLRVSMESNFMGLNGTFFTRARRSMISSGWLQSSHGKVKTTSIQKFHYGNIMVMEKDGNLQTVNQIIEFNDSVSKAPTFFSADLVNSFRRFSLSLYNDMVTEGNGSQTWKANITLGVEEKKVELLDTASWISSSLENLQNCHGSLFVKGDLVRGSGSMQQSFSHRETKLLNLVSKTVCYYRNVSSSGYTVVNDIQRCDCNMITI